MGSALERHTERRDIPAVQEQAHELATRGAVAKLRYGA